VPQATAVLPLNRAGGALTAFRLATGTATSTPVDGITGVAVYRSAAFVARNTPGAKGEIAQLKGSTLASLATGLPAVGRLGVTGGGDVPRRHTSGGEQDQRHTARDRSSRIVLHSRRSREVSLKSTAFPAIASPFSRKRRWYC
jgi:hypothetical protein